ncbi:hypothetical protein ACRAWF_44540 [Streptomyces sp. L7]
MLGAAADIAASAAAPVPRSVRPTSAPAPSATSTPSSSSSSWRCRCAHRVELGERRGRSWINAPILDLANVPPIRAHYQGSTRRSTASHS